MASLLASCQAEAAKQPDPLTIGRAWVMVQPPSFRSFQLCSLCVDKLGLTVCPLVAADNLPKASRKGAASVIADEVVGSLLNYALMTEILNFPITSVLEVVEEMEFSQVASDAVEPRRVNGSNRRAVPPFTRALPAQDNIGTPCEESCGGVGDGNNAGSASGDTSSHGSLPLPPTPHLVVVRIKGALAGRAHGAERVPAQLRLHAEPPPPILVFVCFAEHLEVLQFVERMQGYKNFHNSLGVRMYISSEAAMYTRDSVRRAHRLGDDSAVAQRIQVCPTPAAVEPPLLPARPPELLPANRLPQMVTNDEGEVFWYIPKSQSNNQPATLPSNGVGATAVGGGTATPSTGTASTTASTAGGVHVGGSGVDTKCTPRSSDCPGPRGSSLAERPRQPRGPEALPGLLPRTPRPPAALHAGSPSVHGVKEQVSAFPPARVVAPTSPAMPVPAPPVPASPRAPTPPPSPGRSPRKGASGCCGVPPRLPDVGLFWDFCDEGGCFDTPPPHVAVPASWPGRPLKL
eukprot:TRINITY_DN20916_c0_g1_i2.p1 TRINITY_DN20916_c0_g1~~TRINITY_DN20916_c0_g1_i2.p1  ORF type:complete len:560 (+),score=100.08 TRINITY_DN20916_c0_g1_i2:130-1680(+)